MKKRYGLFKKAILVLSLFTTCGAASGKGLEYCSIPVVKSSEQAPVIDGKMVGSEWKYALTMTGLITNEGPLAQRQATVYYVSDGKSIYVGAYVPAVPEGTVPEVKPGLAYDGKKYTDFGDNDRMEIKLRPPNYKDAGEFYFVGDAYGHTYVEHIKGEHKPIFPEWEYKTSFDAKGWTIEMRLPLGLFGQKELAGGETWGINFNLVRLFPLKYEGLVAGPHSLGNVVFVPGAPAVQLERIGNLPNGELDISVSLREYEGLVATPKEGAYDERKVISGGMALKESGKAARVSWRMYGENGNILASDSKILNLLPANPVTASFKQSFKPAVKNSLELKVEMADSAANFADPAANNKINVLYAATLPFVPFVKDEEAQWKERLAKGTLLGSWRFNPAFFPYWEKAKIQSVFFKGRVREEARKLRVTITSDQGFKAVREIPVVDGVMETGTPDKFLDIPIPGLPAGTYTARGEVLDAAGKTVSSLEREYVRKTYPWEHNTLGLSRGVIKPWTPMRASDKSVFCWGRILNLDGAGLPAQISSQGKPLLASSLSVELREASGKVLTLKPSGNLVFAEKAEDRVRWQGQADLGSNIKVGVTGLAEYDGFTWYEFTLTPVKPLQVDSGRITIALSEKQAQLMHFQSCWARDNFSGAIPSGDGVVFRSIDTVNYGKTGGFSPHVWMGSPTRGLSWFADSDEGWSSTAAKSAIEIVRTGRQVQLVMNIIAKPVTLDKPRTIRFGLMATPFKPLLPIRDIQTRAVNWLSFKDGKTVAQDHMYGWYPPNMDYKQIDEHVPGRRLYFNKHEMGAALPERAVFDNEWGGMEPSSDYPGAPERFGPGIKSRSVHRALTESRIDMLVYYIAELAKKTKMAATYWDITGISPGLPLLENGTAYIDPETGNLNTTFDIRRSRELFKRVATMWQEVRGEPDYMEIHSTNHMGIPFYSFGYNWLNFEWLWPNAKAKRPDGRWQDFIDLRPLDIFATEGSPSQFGVWINSINSGERPDEPAEHRRILRSAIALGSLHNHLTGHTPSIGPRDQLEFAGYWDEDGRVTTDHTLVRASYWRKDGQLELVAVNLDLEPRTVTVRIPLKPLGWKTVGQVKDITGEPELASMREQQRYKSSPKLLSELDTLKQQAASMRKAPETRIDKDTLSLTFTIESHDYRIFITEGK